jgi:hypothetical protein
MGTSRMAAALAVCALCGCGGALQPGLANAPSLNGTPETRVHDVIANGRDACERSMFPTGEVLRGQIPPCTPREKLPNPLSSTTSEPRSPSLHGPDCPDGQEPHLVPAGTAPGAFASSPSPSRWLVSCGVPSERVTAPWAVRGEF